MRKKYIVRLTDQERDTLWVVVRKPGAIATMNKSGQQVIASEKQVLNLLFRLFDFN